MFRLTSGDAPPSVAMRVACPHCGHGQGSIDVRNGQACVFCSRCGKWCYNAPKAELREPQ